MTTPPERSSLPIDDRFVLVPDSPGDAPAHRRFALDPEAARFLGWTVAEAESAPDSHYDEVVTQRIADWSEGRRYCFIIRKRSNDEPLGTVDLRLEGQDGAVSYFVMPDYRRMGLATSALVRLLAWAAEELELADVFLTCSIENDASRSVALKTGFALVTQVDDELRFHRPL